MSERTETLGGQLQQTVFAVGRGQGVGLVIWLDGRGRRESKLGVAIMNVAYAGRFQLAVWWPRSGAHDAVDAGSVDGNGRGHARSSSARGSLPAAPITERQNDA